MTDTQTAPLQVSTVKGKRRIMINYRTRKGKTQSWSVKENALAEALHGRDDLDGMSVDFELVEGHPSHFRATGEAWVEPTPVAPPSPRPAPAVRRGGHPGGRPGRNPQPVPRAADFLNPYNFVPALPRAGVDGELGDHAPRGHQAYHPDTWSGRIRVRLETVTPLLLPDAARATSNRDQHKTFPVRVGPDGAPYLPPTSVKGMLRAAYEAITNSRLGVFAGHDERLAYRMDPHEGIEAVPLRIVAEKGLLRARVLAGDSAIGTGGRPAGDLMYAAWLPRYQGYRRNSRPQRDKHETKQARRYPNDELPGHDDELPRHGDAVWVKTSAPVRHRSPRFSYLEVEAIRPRREQETTPPGYRPGWVCITGRNIMNKHHERVFLEMGPDKLLSVSKDIASGWEALIRNYQALHRQEIADRQGEGHQADDYLGHDPGQTGFSRHTHGDREAQLQVGTLCYGRLQTDADGSHRLTALYPVMISRDLYQAAPAELIDPSLLPANKLQELSPADRVFGWVASNGAGNHKGQLRVGPVHCEQGRSAIEHFGGQGLALAILGEPKPAQARFYAAANKKGDPLPAGSAKQDGYRQGHGLRGRKVYPHHREAAAQPRYWQPDRQPSGRSQPVFEHQGKAYHREYQRPAIIERGRDLTRDNQNRSLLGWVRTETGFDFDLQLDNLSAIELGALLWLLTLGPDHHFRLGGGKPLGLGSVHLSITEIDLRDGEACRADYQDLLGTPAEGGQRIDTPNASLIEQLIADYQQALASAYGNGNDFERLRFIAAFVHAATGSAGLPVHYPRERVQPNPQAENFKWFTANERSTDRRLPLPGLHQAQWGLPLP